MPGRPHPDLARRQMDAEAAAAAPASLLGGALELRDNGRNQTVLECILPLTTERLQ